MSAVLDAGELPAVVGHAFCRLVRVEVIKLLDTRTARVFLVAATLTTLAGMMAAAGSAPVLTVSSLLLSTDHTAGLALPVAAMLAATSEWSRGSSDQLFLLEPRRPRVVAAKAAAVAVLGAGSIVLVAALVAGVVAVTQASGRAVDWAVPPDLVVRLALGHLLLAVFGLGVGTLVRWPSFGLLVLLAVWVTLPSGTWWAEAPTTREGWVLGGAMTVLAVGLPLLLGVRRLVRAEVS